MESTKEERETHHLPFHCTRRPPPVCVATLDNCTQSSSTGYSVYYGPPANVLQGNILSRVGSTQHWLHRKIRGWEFERPPHEPMSSL